MEGDGVTDAAGNYGDEFGDKFQAHILAVAARCPGFVLRYRTALSHEYFVSEAHRSVAKTLFAHVDEHRHLPVHATLLESVKPTVPKDEWETTEQALHALYEDDVSDAHAVMQKVIHFGKHQSLVNTILKMAEDVDDAQKGKATEGPPSYESLRGELDKALLVGEDLLDLGIRFKSNDEERFAMYTNPESHGVRIPTGIPHLDHAMGGGLKKGNLGVVLAPPKKGKSTTLINFGFGATMAAEGWKVAHYSMEMDKEDVQERYDDRLMGKLVKKLKKRKPHEYVAALQERLAEDVVGDLFTQRYHTRTATVGTLRSHLSLLSAEGFLPDVVIVDYADIMKPSRRIGEMRHEQAGIYEDLRQLAGEFDIAIWTASQTSKYALDKDVITIADFAEAFEKAAIADAVWAFCQTDAEKIDGKCRLFGAALRKSEDGCTVECDIRRDICLLRSTGLFDPAYTQVPIEGETLDDEKPSGEVEDVTPEEEQKPKVGKKRKAAISSIKDDAGITKKKGRKAPGSGGLKAKMGNGSPQQRKVGQKPNPDGEKKKRGRKPVKSVNQGGE